MVQKLGIRFFFVNVLYACLNNISFNSVSLIGGFVRVDY